MAAGDIASGAAPEKGAARFASVSRTGRASTAPATPPVVASSVARPAKRAAM